ncbi:MAG: 50S ribosomal protein L6 [Bacilli bacterium]|nr:50S ribosomal protein L6 [Bacilli bacterium]
MSRLGLKPISLPAGVTLELKDGSALVKGAKGEVSVLVPGNVSVEVNGETIHVVIKAKPGDEKQANMNQGTVSANLKNAIKGVSEGWKKELEISGTGYRAEMLGTSVSMYLGYSHKVVIAPVGKYTKISVEGDNNNKNRIVVEGCNRQEVGQTAALIYDSHRPDVYGQKGVHYKGQHLIKKEGKRATSGKK